MSDKNDDALPTEYLRLDGKMHKLDDVRAALAAYLPSAADEPVGEVYALDGGERRVQLAKSARELPVGTKLFTRPASARPSAGVEGYTTVRTSMLRHWLRELNGVRNGDRPNAPATCEHVHSSISSVLAAAPSAAQPGAK